jgi:hypothetical protein
VKLVVRGSWCAQEIEMQMKMQMQMQMQNFCGRRTSSGAQQV